MHAEARAVAFPEVPQEIVDEILSYLTSDSDLGSLKSCTLISKSWVPSGRRHLFHTVTFSQSGTKRWLEAFPVPEESPAHLVRHLCFRFVGRAYVHEKCFECIQWFTNVERVTLSARQRRSRPLRPYMNWRLPQSATSLTISAEAVAVAHILDIMALLPNLDDLSLSGGPLWNGTLPAGSRVNPRWRFGGQLHLAAGLADEAVMDALVEIPTGLRFTEVDICCLRNCFLSTVRLAGACSKTLVKLSYRVTFDDDPEASERSFDLSESPNLQEVSISVSWMSGRLLWIPATLSTLGPTTSPHLSAIKLGFNRVAAVDEPVQTLIKLRDDLGRVADELARVESKFEGTVNLTVFRDEGFKAWDTLNALQRYSR